MTINEVINPKIMKLEDYLQSFFKEEKKTLLSNYPGLTLHRLKNDLSLYALLNGINVDELFQSLYIPHKSHPLTSFFLKLKAGVPLEYITGRAYFYRSYYKVSPDVLIPRSETEILVELASEEIKTNYRNKNCRLLDVGTGSGIIALTLMMEDFATLDVVATDISERALMIAKENYFNLGYAFSKKHRIEFINSDRLLKIEGSYDIILSNPPYIKRILDYETVHPQVQNFEPELALFLKDELYLFWFEEFFTSIYEKLRSTGMSIIEGHENHLEDLSKMALKVGFAKVEMIKDYTNRNRFLRLKKK